VFRSVARPLLPVAVATLIGGIALLAPPIARAAPPDDLQIVARAHYVALPTEKRIHVTVEARATNVTPDPPNGRYFYTSARFAVQPAIRNLTASSGSTTLVARIVSTSKEYSAIEVAFGRSIFHGASYSFTYTFDIVDPGGAPRRDVRVASSLVAFPVWAWGSSDTTDSTVAVSIPPGYAVTIETGDLATSHAADGSTVLTASAIADPKTYFAYVTAERPGAFRDSLTTVRLPEGPVTVQIRAWEDDPDWGARTKAIVSRGLPVLRDLIGLDYQVHGNLWVEEAAGSRLGDYAGVYNEESEVIDVRYDADGYTTLHETAHTWFNDTLLTGRWIAEGWAEYYGVEAGKRIRTDGEAFTLTAQLSAAKIPLNSWGGIGQEPPLTEEYGYAGSYRLAQLIAARSGVAGLQPVWRAAKVGEGSYQPPHPGSAPEKGTVATVEGWQRFLDLLEERTKRSYADLWRQWVVTSDEAPTLDARAAAREDYARTVTAAGDWELPYQVRYTLGAWQFPTVEKELADARSVLADRDSIAAQAARLNLRVPGTLNADFESGTTFDRAKDDAAEELSALTALSSATGELGRPASALESIGLLFANPGHRLESARSAFENGETDSAVRDAQAAIGERGEAADTGRLRVGVVGGALLLLDGIAMGGLALRRRRRRHARPASILVDAPPPGQPGPAA
jgi:hypothetical protein